MPARITKQRYHSFLLRLWLVDEQEGLTWRASLENPHTGERLGFATLERLFIFLQDQCEFFPSSNLTKGECDE
jgi:hypothetical protein